MVLWENPNISAVSEVLIPEHLAPTTIPFLLCDIVTFCSLMSVVYCFGLDFLFVFNIRSQKAQSKKNSAFNFIGLDENRLHIVHNSATTAA